MDRRGVGEGDPFNSDCRARQVPSRPLPAAWPVSDGGGLENRRLGVKRDDRRASHGRADGRSIVEKLRDVARCGRRGVGRVSTDGS